MSTETKQIFGYTPPGPNAGESCVKYFQAFEVEGGIEFRIRNNDAVINSITLPTDQANELFAALACVGEGPVTV